MDYFEARGHEQGTELGAGGIQFSRAQQTLLLPHGGRGISVQMKVKLHVNERHKGSALFKRLWVEKRAILL